MSKLLEAIKSRVQKEVAGYDDWSNYGLELAHLSVEYDVTQPVSFSKVYQYRLETTIWQVIECKAEDKEHLIRNFEHTLKGLMFDVIRQLEHRLTGAYYERDNDKLESALRDLRAEIY
jgi:hypothetical protein